jgi:N-acetylneuraminic acid mutarotase
MSAPRVGHSAIILPNGKVLIVGSYKKSCELFNINTLKWEITDTIPESGSNTNLLPNGKVLVVCANTLPASQSCYLYDYQIGKWSLTGLVKNTITNYATSILHNGMVLVFGGYSDKSCEIYDPTTGTWNYTGSLAFSRTNHRCIVLQNGKAIVIGGGSAIGEIYDPTSKVWTKTSPANYDRYGYTATLLTDGRVLIAGGLYNNNSCEIFNP